MNEIGLVRSMLQRQPERTLCRPESRFPVDLAMQKNSLASRMNRGMLQQRFTDLRPTVGVRCLSLTRF